MTLWPFRRSPWDVAKRVAVWLAAGFVMLSGYGLTKLYPFSYPRYLPYTAWDAAIPFLPWTIWPYGTASYAALIAFLQAPDRLAVRRLFFAVAAAACACWVFFALIPTTYPRELFPLPPPDLGPGIGAWLSRVTHAEFADLRAADSPSNCFPSQHVALAWALGLTWAGFLRRPWARALPVAWAVLVSIGTLTTKQHYLWDVPSGVIVGAGAAWLVNRGIRDDTVPWWARARSMVSVSRDGDLRAISALRARVEAHQWRLDDIPWPDGPLPALDPRMVRLINQVIYIEEIAGLNFRILERAAASDDLRRLYGLFADEERRHADGLRRVLALHGASLQPPGLGNALVLDQFDRLDPRWDADGVLIAVSNPVFETFLDAGTIPFLQNHPSLASPAFDRFVDLVGRDEAAHIATNWIVSREMARRCRGLRGIRMALNPNISRGSNAIPWMSLDVYALAGSLGFDFRSLLPPFAKLFTLHRRYPEFAGFPIWGYYRLFCVSGAIATWTCIGLQRAGILFLPLWTTVTSLTDRAAWGLFGPRLLERRGLPPIGGGS